MDLAYCKDRLSAAGISIDAGLSPDELSAIEREYGFSFQFSSFELFGYDPDPDPAIKAPMAV
jgi:thymidylate synthase